jgi:4-diphosphocytidyl-2-C-methyl-D-erythritol kinase
MSQARGGGAARRARPMRRRLTVEAYAKLNLGLAVGPRRADGFHDLVTVFQSVTLADTLTAEWRPRGFTLAVRHENAALRGRLTRQAAAVVPSGARNLVLRAARLISTRLELPGGAAFTLTKRIPAQAGLGGGSADAAAAVTAMLALHGRRLSRARRIEYASELGSDVPFAMTGGTALGLGRGESLRTLRLRSPFRAIIAMPRWRVLTPEAFRRHDSARNSLTPWDAHLRFAVAVGRQRVDALSLIRRGNRFEHLLGQRRRDLESLLARLRAAGLLEPHLTGSGSAVFGVVPRGALVRGIVARFTGDEPLFAVRSTGRGWRLRVHAASVKPRKGSR